jgi:hypothetical protein
MAKRRPQVKVETVSVDGNECYENYKLIGATIDGW